MKPILIVNTELGWDSVTGMLDGEEVSKEQYERLEKVCKRNNYILIDWKVLSSVEYFLQDYE